MSAPFEDLRLAAYRARAAATLARSGRELNGLSQRLRDRVTAWAAAQDQEADWMEEIVAEAEQAQLVNRRGRAA